MQKKSLKHQTIRRRILTFVSALVLLSMLGSVISLYRITAVNRSLETINRVSVPLGRLLTQIQGDADIFRRELDRSLGYPHWRDPHWKPRPVPAWVGDILENEIERARQLVRKDVEWADPEARQNWENWLKNVSEGLGTLRAQAEQLYKNLRDNNEAAAGEIYPRWKIQVEDWGAQIQWGVKEYERMLRQTFALANSQVSELRTGLEIILVVVVSLSLLLLWLGERALRPLEDLTRLAREITRRGLRKEDKALLTEIPLTRSDEVSQLALEFHSMATSLLERERTVEAQKNRLQEQNRLLKEMAAFNENVLNSIESVLIVTDLDGKITQCNPRALEWLGEGTGNPPAVGSQLLSFSQIQVLPGSENWLERLKTTSDGWRVEPTKIGSRVFGGHLMPLRTLRNEKGHANGAILVLEDLTEEVDLQDRLRRAENLAAVGRLSAQVAHEVRNPLHSIGLEAEMAAELAARLGSLPLKQSLQSILNSVDRLEKITQNYLKLSRLSSGERTEFDIGDVLESVLATYVPVCEAQEVRVDWSRLPGAVLKVSGDRDLLENVLSNLMRNSLQALEGRTGGRISWNLGVLETGRIWIEILDNGPGIPPEIRERLFTPFMTTKAQGTGLGLPFVKKVIEDHGGTIEYLAATQGPGARFQITLPAAELLRERERPQQAFSGVTHE